MKKSSTSGPAVAFVEGVPDDVFDEIAATDRTISRATARRARQIAAAHHAAFDGSNDFAHRSFRSELALRLRISERAADRLIGESREWTDDLPATLAALEAGRITVRHARIIAEAMTALDPDERADLEAQALDGAWRSTGEFARFVKRRRDRRAPDTAIARHRGAFGERRIEIEHCADGMSWVHAFVQTSEAVAISTRFDDLVRAARTDGETRTADQLRADVFTDVLLGRPSLRSDQFEGIVPHIFVTVPAATVAGTSNEPGLLSGGGYLDPATSRELAAIAPTFRRLLVDADTGVNLSLGRSRYRPTEDMRTWIRLRNEVCEFPGCTRVASASDIDHTVDWAEGGATDASNLAVLCRGHHLLKHNTEWSCARAPDGRLVWRSPSGRVYVDGDEPPASADAAASAA